MSESPDRDQTTPDGEALRPGDGALGPVGAPEPAAPRPTFFGDFAELVSGIFISPVATLRVVATRVPAPFGASILAYFAVALISALGASVSLSRVVARTFSELGAATPPASAITFGIVLGALVLGPIGLFFKAGALGLSAGFFGGRGDGRRLLPAFALTYAPALLNTPVGLLVGTSLDNLATVLSLAILVWRLVLDVIAIREVYSVSTGRAAAAALVPLGVLVLAFIAFLVVWLITFMTMVGPLVPHGLPGVG